MVPAVLSTSTGSSLEAAPLRQSCSPTLACAVAWSTPFTDTTNYHSISVSWNQGSNTVINFDGTPYSVANACPLNAFTSSANDHCLGSYGDPWSLSGREVPYANNLVSLQYGDELVGTLPSLATLFANSRTLYPNTIAYSNWGGYQQSAADRATYMATAKPDMIAMDTYPDYATAYYYSSTDVAGHWFCRPDWYSAMQQYRLSGLAGIDGTGTQPIPYAQYTHLFRDDYQRRVAQRVVRAATGVCQLGLRLHVPWWL